MQKSYTKIKRQNITSHSKFKIFVGSEKLPHSKEGMLIWSPTTMLTEENRKCWFIITYLVNYHQFLYGYFFTVQHQ